MFNSPSTLSVMKRCPNFKHSMFAALVVLVKVSPIVFSNIVFRFSFMLYSVQKTIATNFWLKAVAGLETDSLSTMQIEISYKKLLCHHRAPQLHLAFVSGSASF